MSVAVDKEIRYGNVIRRSRQSRIDLIIFSETVFVDLSLFLIKSYIFVARVNNVRPRYFDHDYRLTSITLKIPKYYISASYVPLCVY